MQKSSLSLWTIQPAPMFTLRGFVLAHLIWIIAIVDAVRC